MNDLHVYSVYMWTPHSTYSSKLIQFNACLLELIDNNAYCQHLYTNHLRLNHYVTVILLIERI